jgi:hypothetical protein
MSFEDILEMKLRKIILDHDFVPPDDPIYDSNANLIPRYAYCSVLYPRDWEQQQELESTQPQVPQIETPTTQRIILNVTYQEKDSVKKLGAKWDQKEKTWYIPTGTADIDSFLPWINTMIFQDSPDSYSAAVCQPECYFYNPGDEGKAWVTESVPPFAPRAMVTMSKKVLFLA